MLLPFRELYHRSWPPIQIPMSCLSAAFAGPLGALGESAVPEGRDSKSRYHDFMVFVPVGASKSVQTEAVIAAANEMLLFWIIALAVGGATLDNSCGYPQIVHIARSWQVPPGPTEQIRSRIVIIFSGSLRTASATSNGGAHSTRF
jgi:hypothetical protein